MRLKRVDALEKCYKEEKDRLIPLSQRELYFSGLFLYWGEGGKASRSNISINNTDPEVVKFSLYWMIKCLQIPKKKIIIQVHLYDDMDINQEIHYWSEQLNIPISNFNKPYIKHSKKIAIDQKGFGHGTCTLVVSNTLIKNRILMGIKAIAYYYGQKVHEV